MTQHSEVQYIWWGLIKIKTRNLREEEGLIEHHTQTILSHANKATGEANTGISSKTMNQH